MNKKFLFVGVGLSILALAGGAAFFFTTGGAPKPRHLSVQTSSVSFYDGTFESMNGPIIQIRLQDRGARAHFLSDQSTRVVHVQANGFEESKNLSDIPASSPVQIIINQDGSSAENMTASKIIYRDSVH